MGGASVKSLRAWDIVALLRYIHILVLRVTGKVQIPREVYWGSIVIGVQIEGILAAENTCCKPRITSGR